MVATMQRMRARRVSEEYDGVVQDNDETVRPLLPRIFSSLSEAEEPNRKDELKVGG